MSTSNSGNKTHDDTVRSAEGSRQSGISSTSQSTTVTAEIAFYRSVRASALANGASPSGAVRALMDLGTGGA